MPKRKKVDNLIKIKKKVLFQTYHLEQVRRPFGKQRVIANCIICNKYAFFKRGWQKKKHFSLFYPLLFVILQNHSSISSDT
jgi:hypothetical protein